MAPMRARLTGGFWPVRGVMVLQKVLPILQPPAWGSPPAEAAPGSPKARSGSGGFGRAGRLRLDRAQPGPGTPAPELSPK